jgi:glycosyltransferase involved in cell wall biosynthesis
MPTAHSLRTLVVAGHEPWPLNSGGRLRLYNFLRWLARDATVTLALPQTPRHVEHWPHPLRVVDTTASSAPIARRRPPWVTRAVQRHYGYSPALYGWLAANASPAHYDVALLYGAVTGQYADAIRVPVVWDAVDELVLYTARDAARRGAWHWPRAAQAAALYAAFERHVARRAHATVFASPIDASYARRWAGGARVASISNGVDFDYFEGPKQTAEPGTVAFVGSLSFPPNVEAIVRFATRIWPLIRAGALDRRLLIVGRAPVAAVTELAGLPGVALHADVPDVRPYLARAAAVVVPTRLGGGVKNKVLEACAMRRPVVASPRALAGLTARPGADVLCAVCRTDWVGLVGHLLEHPAAATQLAARGHQWVRRAHAWPHLAGRMKELLVSAAASRATEPETYSCVPPRLKVRQRFAPTAP